MRRITGGVFQSLDGVIQAPGGPTEDPSGDFLLGGWLAPCVGPGIGGLAEVFFSTPHDLLLGRRTYDIFAGCWPSADPGHARGQGLNGAAKYVLTGRDEGLTWADTHRLPDIAAVAALKATPGPDLFVWGSASVLPQLLAAGLLDRLVVMTFPAVLGQGKRLFGDGTPPLSLRLTARKITADGIITAHYEPAGALVTGSIAEQAA